MVSQLAGLAGAILGASVGTVIPVIGTTLGLSAGYAFGTFIGNHLSMMFDPNNQGTAGDGDDHPGGQGSNPNNPDNQKKSYKPWDPENQNNQSYPYKPGSPLYPYDPGSGRWGPAKIRWDDSLGAYPMSDPLILDLNKDGVVDVSGTKYFDLDINGFAEKTFWAGNGDGLLVMDRNGDGIINDGGELFGDQVTKKDGSIATGGFDALSDLDSNSDGIIDANDEAFEQLKVWADYNGDGEFASDELKTLNELGISAVKLDGADDGSVDENGNIYNRTGTFAWENGENSSISEMLLVRDTMDSIASEILDVPEDIAALPDMLGHGNLYSLQQSMVRDESGELRVLVERFINETDGAVRRNLFTQLLYKWGEVSGADYRYRGDRIDTRKVGFMELIVGHSYYAWEGSNYVVNTASFSLEAAFTGFSTVLYAELMMRTHHKEYYEAITAVDSYNGTPTLDIRGALELISARYDDDPEKAKLELSEFVKEFINLGYGNNIDVQGMRDCRDYLARISADMLDTFNSSFSLNISLRALSFGTELTGTSGNDTLEGGYGNDTLIGGHGDDKLEGDTGNDTLIGGTGNDHLLGGSGSDTYIWNLGDGNDVIEDRRSDGDTSILTFGDGVDPNTMYISRSGSDIIFVAGETGERIRVVRWYYTAYHGDQNQLTEVRFANGTVWTQADINAMKPIYLGTDGNDTLNGSNSHELFFGGDGDDTINGENGDDFLFGNAGNDNLNGGYGNDTLIGGVGDDQLLGGNGSDTYIWNPGDGNDTIEDRRSDGDINILKFGDGVDPAKMYITRSGSDIIFVVGETGEKIRVTKWYYYAYDNGDRNQLAEVHFADGTVWTQAEINAMRPVYYGSEGNDTLTGTDLNEIFFGGDGDDTIKGGSGNDVITGGTGDDQLLGGNGSDTYIWNPGDGNDTIEDRRSDGDINILKFGDGVDPEKMYITRSGSDIIFVVGETGERIRVTRWYYYAYDNGDRNQLTKVHFADGTVWTQAEINAMRPVYYGSEGNDTIIGSDLHEIFIGGAGDDYLEGGTGNDTYIWSPGDGSDTIYDRSGTNVLEIGKGIEASEVKISRDGNNVILLMGGVETITIKDWYSRQNYQLSEVRFSDGTIWTPTDINAMRPLLVGTDDDDTINGYGTNEDIFGGLGNDKLYGGYGDDNLVGGAGDDYLEGGMGDDVFIWNPGDGNDMINDWNGANILRIGEGVNSADVQIKRDANNLIFLMGNGETITVKNWYERTTYQLAEVRFADGTVWTQAQINNMHSVFPYTDGDDIINGYDTNDLLKGGAGNDKLYGGDGNDILVGEAGDDYLEGGKGNDTYVWNPGDGNDTINDYKSMNYYTGVLKIGEGIDPADIQLTRSGNDLIFIMGNGETITVTDWYKSTSYQLTSVSFSDGTVWTQEQINAMRLTFTGTDGDDTITGYSTNDILIGGAGNDKLYGGDGNDILVGGKGDDYLEGGPGYDTYIWNPGDGNDTINDYKSMNYYTGVLKIGEGIDPADIQLTRSGNDLIFIMGNGETITVKDWHKSTSYQLTSVNFTDGTIWSRKDVNAIASGTTQPFSTAPQAFSLSVDSGEDLLASFQFEDTVGSLASFRAAPTNWACDPSLASIMNEPEINTAADFAARRLNIDIAAALLQFDGGMSEQVCDPVGAAVSSGYSYMVSASPESAVANYFAEDRQRSATQY